MQALLVSIEDIEARDDDTTVELKLNAPIDPDWKEGVEAFSKFMEEEIWGQLDLPDKKLPFFQAWTDPDRIVDHEGQAWLNDPTSIQQELKPRWHQLVEIYRMLDRHSRASLKTMQVLGAISCLAYYQWVFESKSTFPGDFAACRFPTVDSNVPNLPHIIVCPVNLKAQWKCEIKRFLVPTTFDILPYVRQLDSCPSWWTELFDKSKQLLSQHIVLALQNAIQDDASIIFDNQSNKDKVRLTISGTRFQNKSLQMVYGHQYTFVIMDEVHSVRKHNQIHRVYRGLRERGLAMVAMTATPVTMKAQDLYCMGQWMGVAHFDDHKEFLLLNKEINCANRQDSKLLREAGIDVNIIHGVFISVRNPNTPDLQALAVMKTWMNKIRDHFAPHVIRCTINLVDYAGEKLFGMCPYTKHNLKLKMYDWAMAYLRSLIKENPIASVDTCKNFYIEFRHSMLHSMLNPKLGETWQKPESLETWQNPANTTIKLDTLAKVVLHHLEKNTQAPLTMSPDGRGLVTIEDGVNDDTNYGKDDQIIIYSAFPSSNQALIDILHMYGIGATELNSSMSLKKQQATLEDFWSSSAKKGPRVLILLNVGMVGLNLACANIMIFVDTTWSPLDDEQLHCRIFRYPQQKQVCFYRLIMLGTPDVFLNNISFDKGQLHSAFVGCSDEIQRLFEQHDGSGGDDNDRLLSLAPTDNSNDDVEKPVKNTRAAKTRGHAVKSGSKKSRPTIYLDEDVKMDDADATQATEPSGRNTMGKKKTCDRASKPATKCHGSGGSPQMLKKKVKQTRQDMVAQTSVAKPIEQHPPEAKVVDEGLDKDMEMEVGQEVDKNVEMEVPQTEPMVSGKGKQRAGETPTLTFTPTPTSPVIEQGDPILRVLLAAGSQNDPDKDEAQTFQSLTGMPPTPPLSPLSSPPPMQPEPHSRSEPSQLQGFHSSTHTGNLAVNKDGTGPHVRAQTKKYMSQAKKQEEKAKRNRKK